MIRCSLVLMAVCAGLIGCSSVEKRLEPGGSYNPWVTNSVSGFVTNAPNVALFSIDLTFRSQYNSLDTLFQFEQDNRAALWKVSPQIKHNLDYLRPRAWDVNRRYALARKFYLNNPTPENLTRVDIILHEILRLNSSVQAATAVKLIPK